jgi:phosphoadenosine phosphosulfate reductase
MSLLQLNFEGLNRVEVAVMRLQEFEPPEGYYLAFSGGKDSVVIYDLAVKARVKFDAHYSQGGIDPPELVRFIRAYYPGISFDRPAMPIWKQLMTHGMPRRKSRWCCELIKEHHGSGRRVITGIRWQESPRRRQRQMFEMCRTDDTKIFFHPIIDWASNDVWEYIKLNNLPYCSLYDEGFKRLGCVLCPMETARQTQLELKRFPKLAEAWKRACYRYYEKGTEGTKQWATKEAFWQWWLSRKGETKVNDAQCIMFDN